MPVQVVESSKYPEWAKEVIQYLKEGKLPKDKKQARLVRMQASRYTMFRNTLPKGIHTTSSRRYTKECTIATREAEC
jgi:hypothetical protein